MGFFDGIRFLLAPRQTCPMRASTHDPGRVYHHVDPDRWFGKPRTCSFCQSAHPDDVKHWLMDGAARIAFPVRGDDGLQLAWMLEPLAGNPAHLPVRTLFRLAHALPAEVERMRRSDAARR